VITVGALNDRKSLDLLDDTVATYSSRGPTRYNLVAKPDLLAPGNKIWSSRSSSSTLDVQFPESRVAGDPERPWDKAYFELSGTSMAAPMVSGAAALMLEQEPWLNPATVKARLMLTARKAAVGDPFATGAGALDILAALHATEVVNLSPSPLVFVESSDPEDPSPENASGRLSFENPGVLWGHPAFSLATLWGEAILWAENATPESPIFSSYAALLPDPTASGLLWPEAVLWPNASLWPESTLWAEGVLWPDGELELTVLSETVSDP
jgi:serine protease AprX